MHPSFKLNLVQDSKDSYENHTLTQPNKWKKFKKLGISKELHAAIKRERGSRILDGNFCVLTVGY